MLLWEVGQDCQILTDASHQALTSTEREWFVTKCRNWKVEFDEARLQADTVMMTLVNVLRKGSTV